MTFTKNPIQKLLVATSVAVYAFSANVAAQDDKGKDQPKATPPSVCADYQKSSTSVPGQRVGKKIQNAFEEYSNDNVQGALEILYDIDTSNEFDRAYTDRFIGNLLAAQEGKAQEALRYLTRAVEANELNDSEQFGTMKLVADLSMQEENYREALKWYQRWLDETCKNNPDVYVRMSQAYYETKQLDKMVAPANKAIQYAEKPDKNPYVLKMTSYYERKMYPQAIEVTEQLVKLFPETDQWWTQLAFFYMLVENYPQALQTMDLAYKQGYVDKKSEIKALAQLFATNGIPYKSAKLYEEALNSGMIEKDAKSFATIANTWHQAKDVLKAADYYGKAGALSNDPDHFRRQGSLLMAAQEYGKAVRALDKAISLATDDKGNLYMSMMEANFYQGKFKEALRYVQLAKQDSSTRRSANSWEPYIREKAKNRGIQL
ncbi:hypothetical protein HMF8227_00864 [Saliniradius amylolyticus]|uniref:Uncharacterized protein n=1 Tax=Saliniradius amylolyticus TaxID=2183582 RepID=A0A2S2E192_9ALTE|nr:tetratricopeptide repeat protein [Saliniradius amylolyticus]AWL11359.1 hypothetical protein HMF8227_00864 [Saliniradius amylolyticus]